jgi:PAS domain S-box-containing protein
MLFKNIPIQKKLMRVILLISGVMVLVTSSAFFTYEFYAFRQNIIQKLSTLGKVIATNSTAALAFDNHKDAYEILLALKAEPHIIAASLYDEKGNLFSQYPGNLATKNFPVSPGMDGFRFTGSYLEGFQQVTEGNRRLGTLYLKSNLKGMYQRFRLFAITTIFVIAISLLLAYMLSKIFQKSISRPILALAEAAKTISVNRDFSVRVVKSGNDELGSLTHSFNEMLQQIQEQNDNLEESNQKLDKSEKQYHYLFENSPMPMWVIDLNTFKFLDVNEIAILQYGYSRQEFLSMTTLDIRPDEGKELFKQVGHLFEMSRTNYSKGIWNHRKKDGTIIQVETIGHRIIFEGVPARLILSNDVTERKKAEEKLDKSEKLFRAMIEKDADMKILATHDGKVFYASPSITEILGYENQEFMAMPAFDLIHPDDVPWLIEGVSDIVQTPGKSFYRQQRLKHKVGTWLWCEGTITNMLHEPAVAALVSNFRDITARKHAEEAIKLAEANYREIFDKASDAIYVHEMETGKVIEVNRRAYEITGYTREELLNTDPQEFITGNPNYTLQHALNYLHNAAAGEPQLFEWLNKNKDGSHNWLEINLKKATIAGKDRILSFFREINDRKKAQMEILKLNEGLEQKVIDRTEQLEVANKELEAFSYSVSHDLRAPLRAINGFAKILGENCSNFSDSEGKRLFNRIEENAKKMGLLIDDLLEFSRLGRKEIHKLPMQMTELAEAALLEINTTVNHNAAVKIHQLHPANADRAMIKQVMINLLSNAIKYSSKTKKPSIEFKSYLEKNEIIYSVSDNGAGFNNQFAHKLFGVFQRLHLEADFEGTGVGLALVKRIINKHGGRVWAAGELNKGATFCFSLPLTNNN